MLLFVHVVLITCHATNRQEHVLLHHIQRSESDVHLLKPVCDSQFKLKANLPCWSYRYQRVAKVKHQAVLQYSKCLARISQNSSSFFQEDECRAVTGQKAQMKVGAKLFFLFPYLLFSSPSHLPSKTLILRLVGKGWLPANFIG